MRLYESDKNRSLACPYYWAHGLVTSNANNSHLDAVTEAPAACQAQSDQETL